METVMTSKDTSIRPFADKFIMSSRLECVLTAILKRARNGVLDSWLIYNTSLVGKRQLSSLRNRLHRPTSSYDQASLLGWTASSAGDLLQRHLPNIFTLLQDLASSNTKISDEQNDPNNTESDGDNDNDVRHSEPPVIEVDKFGHEVQLNTQNAVESSPRGGAQKTAHPQPTKAKLASPEFLLTRIFDGLTIGQDLNIVCQHARISD